MAWPDSEHFRSPLDYHVDAQARLKWIVTGDGPALRSEADMRAIIDWIDHAVDEWLLDPDSFEGAMLLAMFDEVFTIASVHNGAAAFQLTEYGRARVDSMPNDLRRLTPDGIK
jgi:hypothetical protein